MLPHYRRSWAQWWSDAFDWCMDNLFMPCLFLFLAALIFGIITLVVFDSTHTCTKWTAPYYHPPTYVMSGKVMVPVGGGTYSDCVEYQPK